MGKDAKREELRKAAEKLFLQSQVAQYPDRKTQEWAEAHSDQERVRIRVERLGTGEAIDVYTYTDDPSALLQEIRKVAELPKDLQDQIELGVGYTDEGDTEWGTMRQIFDKTKLSEGRPSGESEAKRQRYRELAQDYHDTVEKYIELGEPLITQEEFAEDRDISVRTLQRALEFERQDRKSP